MKVTNRVWFSELGKTDCIGIIIGIDEHTGEKKAYIGTGNGVSEEADVLRIASNGAKFTRDIASVIFKSLK